MQIKSIHRKNLSIKVISLLILFWLNLPVLSQEIKVVTVLMPPYQTQLPNGSIGGSATEIVKSMFVVTRDTPIIKAFPWARTYKLASSEPNTLIYSIARTPERENKFNWIGDIEEEKIFFWSIKNIDNTPKNLKTPFQSNTIAASRNSNADQYIQKKGFKSIYQVVNEDQALEMLYRRRVEIIIEAEKTIFERVKTLNLDKSKLIKLEEIPELNNNLSIAFSYNTSPELVNKYINAYKVVSNSNQKKMSALQ